MHKNIKLAIFILLSNSIVASNFGRKNFNQTFFFIIITFDHLKNCIVKVHVSQEFDHANIDFFICLDLKLNGVLNFLRSLIPTYEAFYNYVFNC